MPRSVHVYWLIMVTAGWYASTAQCDHDQTRKLRSVTANLHLEGPTAESIEVRLSGELLTLTVEGPDSLDVLPPRVWTSSPGWRVSKAWAPELEPMPGERRRWRQRVRLEPEKVGETTLALEPLIVRHGPGVEEQIDWQPIAVRVITNVQKLDLSALRDLPEPEELPAIPESRLGMWVLLALCVLAAVGTTAVFVVKRGRRKLDLPPHVWATQELSTLVALVALGQIETPEIIRRLADLLRRYLELRFGVPALEQTTPELIARLDDMDCLSSCRRGAVRDVLKACDPVKFAKAQPKGDEIEGLFSTVREFIHESSPLESIRQG